MDTFGEQIAAAGGNVTDSFDDGGSRLYLRATLPARSDVAPGDRLQAGVAMRADDVDVRVHPYVFRLVCKNGAIFAQAVGTRVIEFDHPGDVIIALEQAVQDCCVPAAFDDSVRQMRGAMEHEADRVLTLLPFLSRLPRRDAVRLLDQILRRFRRDGDRSGYGLLNAVTATARQTRDPETRWRLEELGGGIPALLQQRPRVPGTAVRAERLVPA
jgi:hypothetical protein